MLEYKEGLSASFARELLALANTAGGKILLGVRDDGTIKGIVDTNQLRARIQDIARNCDPPVKILLQRIGDVIVVTVRKSDAKPVQCSDGYFWRQGAVTQKLSRDEIRDLFRREGAIRFDTSCSKFRYPQDFDREKYNAWFRLSGITGRLSTEDVLVNIEAAERSGAKLLFRNAGVFRNLERALAIYGAGGGSGKKPVEDKSALVAALRQVLSETRSLCQVQGVNLAAIQTAQGFTRIGLLDRSIATEGYVIREAAAPYGSEHWIDLSNIDFEKLAEKFKAGRKRTVNEKLKGTVAQKLMAMVRLNRTRMDYLERFQEMIDAYNAGSLNAEEFFQHVYDAYYGARHSVYAMA